jgi:Rrf2 family protein
MLNRKSVYALHALQHLAQHPDERFSTARLAEACKSPRRFLEQILSALREAGLLLAESGRSGGYQLARPASEVSLADILRVVEGPIALLPCASHRFTNPARNARIRKPAPFKTPWCRCATKRFTP